MKYKIEIALDCVIIAILGFMAGFHVCKSIEKRVNLRCEAISTDEQTSYTHERIEPTQSDLDAELLDMLREAQK
ncbi:MAG: hypothetical protein ACN2B6_12395 [Rickettsiales bacterium]